MAENFLPSIMLYVNVFKNVDCALSLGDLCNDNFEGIVIFIKCAKGSISMILAKLFFL